MKLGLLDSIVGPMRRLLAAILSPRRDGGDAIGAGVPNPRPRPSLGEKKVKR